MSIFTNITSVFKDVQAFAPATLSTTQTSSAIDLDQVMDAWVEVNVGAGTISGSNTLTFKVQECATSGGTYVDMAASQYQVANAWNMVLDNTSYQSTISKFQIKPTQRYIKTVATVAASFSAIVGITVHYSKRVQPAQAN